VRRTGNYGNFPTRIRDARPIEASLSLERQGFRLVRHPSAVRNFLDEAEVRSVYFPEVERLVAEETGAAEVVVDRAVDAAEIADHGAAGHAVRRLKSW